MKPWRYPLALRLLTGLLLNFLLIAALFVALPGRGGIGWDLLLTAPVRERLLNVGHQLARTLAVTPAQQWQSLLAAESAQRGVQFSIREGFGGGPPPQGERQPPPQGEHPPFDAGPGMPPRPPPGTGTRPGPPRGGAQTDRSILADMIAVERSSWREGFAVRIPMQVNSQPVDLTVQTAGWVPLLRFLGIAD